LSAFPQVQPLATAIGTKSAQQVSDYSQYVCEVSFVSQLSQLSQLSGQSAGCLRLCLLVCALLLPVSCHFHVSAELCCLASAAPVLFNPRLFRGEDSDRVLCGATIGYGPPREGLARRAAAEACASAASCHASSRPRELRPGHGGGCAAGCHGGGGKCAERRHPAEGDAQVAALARHPCACPHASVAH
jgi:hypothetical protein